MKLSAELWDTISLYIRERDGWRCWFVGKLPHRCNGIMQANHIWPRGRTRMATELALNEQNMVCACQAMNWQCQKSSASQAQFWELIGKYEPERHKYLIGVLATIMDGSYKSTPKKKGTQQLLLNEYREKLARIMKRRHFTSAVVTPPEPGIYITQLVSGLYVTNKWDGVRWRQATVQFWSGIRPE